MTAEDLVRSIAADMFETLTDDDVAAIAQDAVQDIRIEIKQTLSRTLTIEDYVLPTRRADRLSE